MPKTILVLGAYGLIGAGVARALKAQGFVVEGLGRNGRTARRVLPDVAWHIRDLAALCDVGAWDDLLRDVDVVVNCAGALQAGPEDDLAAVHHRAVAACAAACAGRGLLMVQISAVGAEAGADTEFMRSKAAGDAAIVASGARHLIIRPGLVLAPTGYGGTMLLRMLAAVPLVQPVALGQARIQTVGLDALAGAVVKSVRGDLPEGAAFDLVEEEAHSLRQVLAALRHWLGFAPARLHVAAPKWLVRLSARTADGLGRLGWRSPLRSTAMQVLETGVTGDPATWRDLGQAPVAGMQATLAAMPARAEDRLFARMALMMPLVVAVLAVFWIGSGVVGLMRAGSAAEILRAEGWGHWAALASVIGWSLVDILLGVGVMFRRFARHACLAMILVSGVYLVAASVVTPMLWLDPLGPLLKIFPAMVLALLARSLLESR